MVSRQNELMRNEGDDQQAAEVHQKTRAQEGARCRAEGQSGREGQMTMPTVKAVTASTGLVDSSIDLSPPLVLPPPIHTRPSSSPPYYFLQPDSLHPT